MTWVTTDRCTFYLHEEESLLDGLLRTGHKPDYQCREGYCGSCRLQVAHHSRDITYKNPPLATINSGELLACCCEITGVIKLKF